MSQIRISKKVKEKLDTLKSEFGSTTYNEVINLLIEKYYRLKNSEKKS